MDHEKFMRAAAALAEKNVVDGTGGPFGAVIVRDSEIVGEGTNQVTSSNDPTAHAEVVAIRQACERLETFNLEGCVVYTSCEPCPMCLSAIYWARLDRIFYGNTRPMRRRSILATPTDCWIMLNPAAGCCSQSAVLDRCR